MVKRYTRPEMGSLWGPEARFENMKAVEIAVAKAQAEEGLIPKEAAVAIAEKAEFSVDRILEIEKETRHDVIAFVTNMAENVGEHGRYIHYGLTSSDVLDTAMSYQVQKAGKVLLKSLDHLIEALKKKSLETAETLCSGRTHGMHAEPTTFGYKLAGFYQEFLRNKDRISRALSEMAFGKLSGAVGTYSFLGPSIEKKVCEQLGLQPEPVATQVLPRDRHAQLITTFALCGGALERLSVELRHLQRNEVNEALEGFRPGQKGSSAMPHKKNPISSENLTGCARLLRSHAQCALENIALWHERDISHSSVERVVFPDSFILLDYALHRMAGVIENLQINTQQMLDNMNLSKGQLFSSHLLLHIVDQGLSREEAYKKIQTVSHGLKAGDHLKTALLKHPETKNYFDEQAVGEIFSGQRHMGRIRQRMGEIYNGV